MSQSWFRECFQRPYIASRALPDNFMDFINKENDILARTNPLPISFCILPQIGRGYQFPVLKLTTSRRITSLPGACEAPSPSTIFWPSLPAPRLFFRLLASYENRITCAAVEDFCDTDDFFHHGQLLMKNVHSLR